VYKMKKKRKEKEKENELTAIIAMGYNVNEQ
jgi:hypothetical protein